MENRVLLHNITKVLKLGILKAQPHRVSGGYMHKMYCLETDTGKYAVKLLNSAIMKRPDVFQNYQKAERLERVLQEQQIPIVQAIELNGCKMQCIDHQYFYIFPWIEGRTLGWDEIQKEHCEIAGSLLAKIHRIEQSEKPFVRDDLCIDWDSYIELAVDSGSAIADLLHINRELIYNGQDEYNKALKHLPPITSICDGDMDSKNVMWVNGRPLIIDLECLDYGNPCLEMFDLALSWSGGVICHIDYELLKAFITSYQEEYGSIHVDLKELYGIGFKWLEWLEYNVKRALMIENNNEEERKLGIEQILQTMDRIIYYASIKEELLQNLGSMFK